MACGAALTAAAGVGALALDAVSASASSPSPAALRNQINANQHGASQLQSGIRADTATIDRIEGRASAIEARQSTLQSTLRNENAQLGGIATRLKSARLELSAARQALVSDREVLRAELLAQYESPPPDMTTVLFEAHGFADLLERVSQIKDIVHEDVLTAEEVSSERATVQRETTHLESLMAQHQRVYAAALVQRDELAQVHLAVVRRELRYARYRGLKSAHLAALQGNVQSLQSQLTTLEQQQAALQRQEAAAVAAPSASYVPSGAGYHGTAFDPHGGEYGLFLAPGTNYTVNEEPEIAARLDALGIALHLHLTGVSGYRTPAHSVAVGGFADDPHTRGQASDTPGIEGVPESVLEQFGLERPFPGAAEADHIQLLGSIPVES